MPHIIRAKNDADFGIKARDAFDTALIGVSDLPWVILPTGKTPLPFYDALKADGKTRQFHYLQLDDYAGLDNNDPIRFANWLERDILGPLGIIHRMTFNSAANPEEEVARIRAWYDDHQRVDVAVIGIGENGHVGFNEPDEGFHFGARARVVKLTEMTRQANNAYWGREVPENVITLGIPELRLAKETILLVRGANKAEILKRALTGSVTPDVPASYLQHQENVTVIADNAALSQMP